MILVKPQRAAFSKQWARRTKRENGEGECLRATTWTLASNSLFFCMATLQIAYKKVNDN